MTQPDWKQWRKMQKELNLTDVEQAKQDYEAWLEICEEIDEMEKFRLRSKSLNSSKSFKYRDRSG